MTASVPRPNILFVLCDQLRARSAPPHENQVPLPAMERMLAEGVECRQALSTCPLCTPYRGMLLTGRHPQTTGMIVNFTSTRAGEIGLGDAFARAGYRTGYVGKWHLHRGAFPSESLDFIPEGRARLGFEYWRAYNCHIDFWNGAVNGTDWDCQRWKGYETEGLLEYADEFLQVRDERPWLLALSVHQPHWNWAEVCAPEDCYAAVPAELEVPGNVPDHYREEARRQYRHYLAMIRAVDVMLGKLLERAGPNTIVVFTSDHGTLMGAQAYPGESGNCWGKSRPHEECIHVPLYVRWPERLRAGSQCDELITPVDLFPTLCGLAGLPVPRTVEGYDLSAALAGGRPPRSRQSALLMSFHNYTYSPNLIRGDGHEWRGVRTLTHTYVRWRDGRTMLYDLRSDPGQLTNLAGDPAQQEVVEQMEAELWRLLEERGDAIHPYGYYRSWIDSERRIVRNASGPLPHPDTPPDWSLLH